MPIRPDIILQDPAIGQFLVQICLYLNIIYQMNPNIPIPLGKPNISPAPCRGHPNPEYLQNNEKYIGKIMLYTLRFLYQVKKRKKEKKV